MKRTAFLLTISLGATLALTACNTAEQTGKRLGDAADRIADQLDPEPDRAVYYGVTPCADCEGIETTLLLRNDGKAFLKEVFMGKLEPYFSRIGDYRYVGDTLMVLKDGEPNATQRYVAESGSLRMCAATPPYARMEGEVYLLQRISNR